MRQLLQQLVDGGGHLGGPPLSLETASSLHSDAATMIDVGRLCEVARAVSITTCSVLGSFLSQVWFIHSYFCYHLGLPAYNATTTKFSI